MQVLIDGLVERQLSDDELSSAFEGLVSAIEMTPVGDLLIQPFVGTDYGASAVQFLVESHIILNYWHEQVKLDIFSCKDFNQGWALECCVEQFLIKTVTRNQLITRGFR